MKKINIVIIDDEMESLANFLYQLVDSSSLQYTFFKDNALESVDFVEKNDIDAAFIDIRMPSIDGISLAQRYIAVKPKIKIIFITALTFDEDKIKKKIGSNLLCFLYKPFDTQKVNHAIAQLRDDKGILSLHLFGYTLSADYLGSTINFHSKRSEELLAYLYLNRGRKISQKEILIAIFSSTVNLSKRLYRDAVIKLRLALTELGLASLIEYGRGSLLMKKGSFYQSDYENYLKGDTSLYKGIFLSDYEWSKQYFWSNK